MFISKEYVEKVWTNHERRPAQDGAFVAQEEYILPGAVRRYARAEGDNDRRISGFEPHHTAGASRTHCGEGAEVASRVLATLRSGRKCVSSTDALPYSFQHVWEALITLGSHPGQRGATQREPPQRRWTSSQASPVRAFACIGCEDVFVRKPVFDGIDWPERAAECASAELRYGCWWRHILAARAEASDDCVDGRRL